MPFEPEKFLNAAKEGNFSTLEQMLGSPTYDLKTALAKPNQEGDTLLEQAFITAANHITAEKAAEFLNTLAILNENGIQSVAKLSDKITISQETLAGKIKDESLLIFAVKQMTSRASYASAVELLIRKGGNVQELATLSFNEDDAPSIGLYFIWYLRLPDLLALLIEKGMPLPDALTVFEAAARRRNWVVVEAILKQANLDLKQSGGPMLYAVVGNGGWKIAKSLIAQGVDCQYKTQSSSMLQAALDASGIFKGSEQREGYQSALSLAMEVITSLLNASTFEERQRQIVYVKRQNDIPDSIKALFNDYFDVSQFAQAVRSNNAEQVKVQLAKKYDVAIDVIIDETRNHTALTFAAMLAYTATLQALLAHPVKPNLKHCIKSGEDAVTLLVRRNSLEGIRLLIAAGADLNADKNLFIAAENDGLDVFKYMYENSKVSTAQQQQLLLEALKSGQIEIIKYLLAKGILPVSSLCDLASDILKAAKQFAEHAQPVYIEKFGQYFAPNGSNFDKAPRWLAIAKLLLAQPLCAEVFNPDIFLQAASNGNLTAMQAEWQKAKGKDIIYRHLPDGRTALHLAIDARIEESKKLEIILFLLNNGADPNGKDNTFTTPLTLAVRGNYASLVMALLAKQANPNIENNNYHTVEAYAHCLRDTTAKQQLFQAINNTTDFPRIPYELPMFTAREFWYKCTKVKDPERLRAELQKPSADANVTEPFDSHSWSPLATLIKQWLEIEDYYPEDKNKLRVMIAILLEMGANPLQQGGRYVRENALTVLDSRSINNKRSKEEVDDLKKQLQAQADSVAGKRKQLQESQQRLAEASKKSQEDFAVNFQRDIQQRVEAEKMVQQPPAISIVQACEGQDTSSSTWLLSLEIIGLSVLAVASVALIGLGLIGLGILPGFTLFSVGIAVFSSQLAIASFVGGGVAAILSCGLTARLIYSYCLAPDIINYEYSKLSDKSQGDSSATISVSEVTASFPSPTSALRPGDGAKQIPMADTLYKGRPAPSL